MVRLIVISLGIFWHLTVVAEVKSLPIKRVVANFGIGCKIAAKLPEGKQNGIFNSELPTNGGLNVEPLPKSWKSSMDSLYFDLYCIPADTPFVANGKARWNAKRKLWEKNLDNWFVPSPTGYEREVFDKATRLLNITAINATGYVGIFEDKAGDEEFRRRRMSFCLFNPPKAACGHGVVGLLREGRKGDLTQQALKIISSIEFLPDSPEVILPNEKPEPATDGSGAPSKSKTP